MKDAFSKYHPAVNFLFFVGAIGCSVVIQHPAYLLAGACCGTFYYFSSEWKKRLDDDLVAAAYVPDPYSC